jgi:hypothetical protein
MKHSLFARAVSVLFVPLWAGVAAQAGAPPRPAAVFYFDASTPERCAWRLFAPATAEERTFLETPGCPDEVIWAPPSAKTYFRQGHGVFVQEWGKKDGVRPLATIPGPADGTEEIRFWFDKKTGRLRFARLDPIDVDKAVHRGDQVFYPWEGQTIDVTVAFAVGMPAMAIVEEQGPDGRWKRVESAPTNSEACDTMGFSAVHADMNGDAGQVSLARLEEAAVCGQGDCSQALKTRLGFADAAQAALQQKVTALLSKKPPAADEPLPLTYAPVNKSDGYVARLDSASNYYAVWPVFYCRNRCADITRLDTTTAHVREGDALRLAVSGPYALVDLGAAEAVLLFNAVSGAPPKSFPNARRAVWMTVPGVWEAAAK